MRDPFVGQALMVRRPSGVVQTDYARNLQLPDAVLQRCEDQCENPACTGMPPGWTGVAGRS